MSTINDTDLFLVNRAGSSYKTTASNISSATDTDLFLVTRAGSSYKVAKSDVDDIADTDLLLCDRAGSSYKVSGADFKDLFTSVTLGTFSPTIENQAAYGGVGSILQSTCVANQSFFGTGNNLSTSPRVDFNGSVGIKVSVNDLIQVQYTSNDESGGNRIIELVISGSTYPLNQCSAFAIIGYECNWAGYVDLTCPVNGEWTGIVGMNNNYYGIGRIKINGDLIYAGATYETGINEASGTTETCGTFTVTTNSGGNPGTFLQSATCSNTSYIRDVSGEMYISCSTPFVVSANDTVSVRCNHDGSNSATISLVMPGETNLTIGSLTAGSTWKACNDTIWKTVTLPTSGTITGLTVTGGNISDAFGVGQMKINGYLIYNGSTYETGIN